MLLDLKTNLTILNIFKNENKEWIENFIKHHCEKYTKVIMLNTGSIETFNFALTFVPYYPNLTIVHEDFKEIDFSLMRNSCLDIFEKIGTTEFYCWIDTDELLHTTSNQIQIVANIIQIAREDASKRFTTFLNRLYHKHARGVWKKRIHEHFKTYHSHQIERCPELTIEHLASEVTRPLEKKELYFDLLLKEFNEGSEKNNRQQMVDALQNLIWMASHDLRQPEKVVELFKKNRKLILSMTPPYEISLVQKIKCANPYYYFI